MKDRNMGILVSDVAMGQVFQQVFWSSPANAIPPYLYLSIYY